MEAAALVQKYNDILSEIIQRHKDESAPRVLIVFGTPTSGSEIPCRVSSDPHERCNDLRMAGTDDAPECDGDAVYRHVDAVRVGYCLHPALRPDELSEALMVGVNDLLSLYGIH